jgi:putative SOS response-associated peptidase YedK
MCGRYTLSRIEEIWERFGIGADGLDLRPRFNVCPEQTMPVVVTDGANRLEMMQWGLIPFWSKEPKSLAINARIEGILSKPSFRKPIRYNRCLVPATGFYEWKKEPAGKTPYYIHRKDGNLFAFAGLYDTWKQPDGAELKTFAIVTTAPTDFMVQVHNRMPVILAPEQEAAWLTTAPDKTDSLLESLQPLSPELMEMYPVSRKVNWGGNDSPDLIQSVAG